MTTLLKLDSALSATDSVSLHLLDTLVQHAPPSVSIITRNLRQHPVPHLSETHLAALSAEAADRSREQQQWVEQTDQMIDEVKAADILLIGAPMYNFSIPSVLKAWFDHIIRAGVTFRYSDQGPEGLLHNKRAIIVTSQGGQHRGQPEDHVVPYLITLLNFIGITRIDTIYAEGLKLNEQSRQQAIQSAQTQLIHLAQEIGS